MTALQVIDGTHVHSARCERWEGAPEFIDVLDALDVLDQFGLDVKFYPCVKFKVAANTRPRRTLDFNPEDYDDESLCEFFMGRKLHWWNNVGEYVESASLYPNGGYHESGTPHNAQTRIHYTKAGRRILTFCEMHGGFRSIAIDDLIKVT